MLTQRQHFDKAHRQISDGNTAFMELVNHPTNPLTREDLAAILARRPERWSRFAGFLDKLPSRRTWSVTKSAHGGRDLVTDQKA